MATLLAASCESSKELLHFDNPPNRLSHYWEKLERQLTAYERARTERDQIDPDKQPPNEERQVPRTAQLSETVKRWGMRHNGRTIEIGDRTFDPAADDCDVAVKLHILDLIRTDSQPVRDLAWELDASTLCYKRETAVYCPAVIRERVAHVGLSVVGESELWQAPTDLLPAAPYLTTTRAWIESDGTRRYVSGKLTIDLPIGRQMIVKPLTAGIELMEAIAASCRAIADYERRRLLAACGS